uniref:FMRFamide-3 n=1 Tax=Sarcophaga bullata TaxID=7385 RepID=FAR3_SARBU|nr:RecName: Full=FMRFamide-3; AltName: Full=SabFMRFamide-3 [Sarcophaga bullata]
SPPSQDFMRF